MQHQQQVGGGGPQPLGGYGHPQGGAAAEMVIGDEDQKLGDLGIAEAASPISSRPPAPAAIGNNNFEEMIQATAEVGGSSGNRWPRQETLALLQIRSEMDAAFRDATLKGPLWEQVSRKLAEVGYKRSAKKCKEKFENVHKYYKRTKEGRGGRQDGKSYKFFSQLEALHHNTSTAVQGLPRIRNPTSVPVAVSLPPPIPQPNATVVPAVSLPPPDHIATGTRDGSAVPLFGNVGVSFSTNSSSSSEGEDEEDEEEMEMDSTENPNQRKRKRSHGGTGSVDGDDQRMMDFFEGLLKQVMQKQEAMQQKFLEAIEKREQDRMIREEAWKRQDMARIAREQELMAQERAISSSRDAAIIAFLEKITGQTIHLPTTVPQNPPPPVPAAADATTTAAAVPPPSEPQEQHHRQPTFQQQRQSERPNNQNQRDQPQSIETIEAHQVIKSSSDIIAAAPKQQIPVQDFTGGSIMETTSSRWPKAEVLALIELRSGMESKYQEAGPKGPLWEEISAGMQRMGYNRSAKRCKEKWENINKYFKKVKESNKKRPEDSKTCPYFHELDALYRKKILGSTSGNVVDVGGSSSLSEPERKLQQQQDIGMLPSQSLASNVSEDKDGRRTELHASGVGAFSSTPFGQHNRGNTGGEKQPEDMLKKQHQQSHGDMINNCHNSVDCSSSNDLDQENDEDNYEEVDENEEYDDKTEEETRMVYKIQFQRQNVGSSNGGRTAPSSIVAMVQ